MGGSKKVKMKGPKFPGAVKPMDRLINWTILSLLADPSNENPAYPIAGNAAPEYGNMVFNPILNTTSGVRNPMPANELGGLFTDPAFLDGLRNI